MSIYRLADCNNFFVSCKWVFRPALEGRPAVVLSSNDGCIVARSDEAKALGVKMAQPAFQAKDLIERHSIAVISGNLPFYTDMSNRVMQVFGELVPAVEKYSIDECFLDLTGIPEDFTAFCQDLKRTVWQWTGLPISIGIAETKSLCSVRSGNLASPRAGVYPGAGRSVILVIHESVQTNMENQYAERPG